MRLEHFCEAHPPQVMQFLISKFVLFFDTMSCFASVGLRNLKCSKIGHARRMVNFTREITPVKSRYRCDNDISANFCRTAKSLEWLENNFLRSSLYFPSLIAAEQYAYCYGGKINFWSHLNEERPGKPEIFHRTPFRGRIESIKSAGKRSQKVT